MTGVGKGWRPGLWFPGRLASLALLVLALLVATPGVSMAQFDHDHTAWNQLLSRHVRVLPGGHATAVSYRGLAIERVALRNYLASLSRVTQAEYDAWTRPQRLAFLINAYNAFTVEKILTRYPDLKSIRDFGTVFGNPWKDRFFTLLGEAQHLDGVEHEVIRKPGAFDEPRIHFAVNCAAVGCPALREEAYVALRLEAQLQAQTLRFLSDRSRNRIVGTVGTVGTVGAVGVSGGRLELSRIFDWYGGDFVAGRGRWVSLVQFLSQHAQALSGDERERQALREGRLPIHYLDYDWRLNDAAN